MKKIKKSIIMLFLLCTVTVSSLQGLTSLAATNVNVSVNHYLQNGAGSENYSLYETVNYSKPENTSYPIAEFEKRYDFSDDTVDYSGMSDLYEGYHMVYGTVDGVMVNTVNVGTSNMSVDIFHNVGYEVHLEGNGATINNKNVTSYVPGSTTTLPSEADMSYPNYRFDGWFENNTFSGNPVSQISPDATGEKFLYAKWHYFSDKEITVNHYSENLTGGGYSILKSEKEYVHQSYGSTVTMSSLAENYDGHLYSYGTLNDTSVSSFTLEENQTVNIYYQRKSYNLTTKIASESAAYISSTSGDGTYKFDETVTIDAVVKDGYKFSFWKSDYTGFVDHGYVKKYTFKMPANDITMTGNIMYDVSSITYELNGGYFTDTAYDSYFYGEEYILPTAVEKYGYVFGGWYEKSDFSGNAVTKIYSTETEPKKYYAKWNKGETTYRARYWIDSYGTYVLHSEEWKKEKTEDEVNASKIAKEIPGYAFKNAKVDNLIVSVFTPNIAGTSVVNLYYETNSGYIPSTTFTELEAVHVHTPVVSPVFITDADSSLTERNANGEATSWSGDKNTTGVQLVESKINANVDYQMMVDGTYHFKFDDVLNSLITTNSLAEAIRYFDGMYQQSDYSLTDILKYIESNGWTGSYNASDKYTNYKYVHFPFPVVLDGVYYEPSGNNGDTWIVLDTSHFETAEFYIPTWVDETEYCEIEFLVVAKNAWDSNLNDPSAMNHIIMDFFNRAGAENTDIYNDEDSKYYAYYKIPVQVSGRIYDFKVNGINDADSFTGVNNSWDSDNVSFTDIKEEKTGSKNRIGESKKRYTKTGEITAQWKAADVLPLTEGSSNVYSEMGTVLKGTILSYSFKTMGSMADYDDDTVKITPKYRYVYFDESGNEKVIEHDDLGLYYNNSKNSYIKYNSDTDIAIKNTTSIGNERFRSAYLESNLLKTLEDYNNEKNINYTKNGFLERKIPSYNLSSIQLNSELRLFSGSLEELKLNINNSRDNLTQLFGSYIKSYTLPSGNSTTNVDAFSTNITEKFYKSMQTWYGEYNIPNNLMVCVENPDYVGTDINDNCLQSYYNRKYDLNNDGFFDLMEYILSKGTTAEQDDKLWLKNGYLILTFEITTVEDGEDNLAYDSFKTDQWAIEGMKKTTTIEGKTVTLRSGDICVVDVDKSLTDKYDPALMMLN